VFLIDEVLFMAKGFNARGGGGMPSNMSNLMKQAQKMQEELAKTQSDISKESFTGSAGGGAVTATVSGECVVTGLKISEEVLDDAEMAADLVMAAVNQAISAMQSKKDAALDGLTGGLGGGFGGLL
jgi:DNA-binding YbaB/EbfC family protein